MLPKDIQGAALASGEASENTGPWAQSRFRKWSGEGRWEDTKGELYFLWVLIVSGTLADLGFSVEGRSVPHLF